MSSIRRLCVYCGSSVGLAPQHRVAAAELGARLAAAGIGLVFGGGRIGLMGVLADAVLAGGGHVTGIIPAGLRDSELAHRGVSELMVVANMHDRKRLMAENADGFAVFPGGIGTLDETFEIMTWRQLGLHNKPIWVVDIEGYWQPLLKIFDHFADEGFATALVPRIVSVVPSVAALIDAVLDYRNPSPTLRSDLL